MPKSSQRPRNTFAVSYSLTTAGLVISSFPASVAQEQMSSAAPVHFTCALPSVSECTFSVYLASAHIETRSSFIVTPTIVAPDLVDFKQPYPVGSIANPSAPVTATNGETAFLTIVSQNQVCIELSIGAMMLQNSHSISPLTSDAGSWASPAN